jgi:SNF2 family DNA or RNA helicase
MSEGNWVIDGDILKVTLPEGILTPTSDLIFSIEFGNVTSINGIHIRKPSLVLDQLKFSKYPLMPEIWIIGGYDKQRTKCSYSCHIIVKSEHTDHEILTSSTDFIDHLIIDNTWFPIVRGSLEEVRKILDKGLIRKPGKISLKQFFFLLGKPSDLINVRLNPSSALKISGDVEDIEPFEDSVPGFQGTLYPYQIIGYNWLKSIAKEDLGCILADEMGLGKTIQIICLILSESSDLYGPVLIVCPATVLENWRRELKRFAPGLSTMVHQGGSRSGLYSDLLRYNVVITSYDIIIRDITLLRMIKWNLVVADEAQSLKNPDAMRTKKIKSLNRRISIAVTGTPVENALTDLWSLFDFVIPGFLGTQQDFEQRFQNIPRCASDLEPLVSPIILRRTVSEVAKDLPERIDMPQALELSLEAARDYETIRQSAYKEYGVSGGLVSLQKLRMFCTHPLVLAHGTSDPAIISPKYQRLTELLEEIFMNEEKVLIFTSFSEMIDIFLKDLPTRIPGIYIDYIDGRVDITKRQNIVDDFNLHDGPGVLLLNPRAAGTGLNLTGANHVIHYNPEWNPAIEDQASARAYRRGQKKPVTIHRLFYLGTVEEIICNRLDYKRELQDEAVVGTTGGDEDMLTISRALEITPFHGEI